MNEVSDFTTLYPVSSQHCFDVHLTSITFKNRWIDAQIIACVNRVFLGTQCCFDVHLTSVMFQKRWNIYIECLCTYYWFSFQFFLLFFPIILREGVGVRLIEGSLTWSLTVYINSCIIFYPTDACVQAHNVKRALHVDTNSVTYDSSFEAETQNWADHLASNELFEHAKNLKHGENLYKYWTSDLTFRATCDMAMNGWQVPFFLFLNPAQFLEGVKNKKPKNARIANISYPVSK